VYQVKGHIPPVALNWKFLELKTRHLMKGFLKETTPGIGGAKRFGCAETEESGVSLVKVVHYNIPWVCWHCSLGSCVPPEVRAGTTYQHCCGRAVRPHGTNCCHCTPLDNRRPGCGTLTILLLAPRYNVEHGILQWL
jgi:hypothetical protein